MNQQNSHIHVKEEEVEVLVVQDGKYSESKEVSSNITDTMKSKNEDKLHHLIKTEENKNVDPAKQIKTEEGFGGCRTVTEYVPNHLPPHRPGVFKSLDSSDTDNDKPWNGHFSNSDYERANKDPTRHHGGKSFSCSQCGKKFHSQRTLQRHLEFHYTTRSTNHSCKEKRNPAESDVGSKKKVKRVKTLLTCEQCGKTFTCSTRFKDHNNLHTGEKVFVCEECGKTYKCRVNFKAHRLIHTKEKRFVCSFCGKAFVQQSCLKAHMMIHSGEKPFGCDKCKRRFRLRTDLKRHMVRHLGVKPYGCGECGARFTLPGSLVKHTKIHRGERLFACDKCEKRFYTKWQLGRHTTVHSAARKGSSGRDGVTIKVEETLSPSTHT